MRKKRKIASNEKLPIIETVDFKGHRLVAPNKIYKFSCNN